MADKLKIDTQLFIEIILSEEGITKEFEDTIAGITIGYFKGKKGIIAINLTPEFTYNKIARAHMRQLGIDDLILRLFPSD